MTNNVNMDMKILKPGKRKAQLAIKICESSRDYNA